MISARAFFSQGADKAGDNAPPRGLSSVRSPALTQLDCCLRRPRSRFALRANIGFIAIRGPSAFPRQRRSSCRRGHSRFVPRRRTLANRSHRVGLHLSRHLLDRADSPKARRMVESRPPLHEEMRFSVSSSRQGDSRPMKDRGDRTVVSTWPSPSGIVWSNRREGILRRFPAVSSRTQMELLRRTIAESPCSPYGWEGGPTGDGLCVPRCFPAERSRGRLTAA